MTAWCWSIAGVDACDKGELACPVRASGRRRLRAGGSIRRRRPRGARRVRGSFLAVHGEDRAEVFADEDAALADLAEEAAFGVASLLLVGGPAEQGRLGERGRGVDVGEAGERVQHLGLAASGWSDDHDPGGVSVNAMRRRCGQRDVDGSGVREVKPSLEDLTHVGDGHAASLRLDGIAS